MGPIVRSQVVANGGSSAEADMEARLGVSKERTMCKVENRP